ncbi:GIY-YIG nuclease family protein [Lampropedia puyangensis]|uniref:GIY-YIG nuclease family protein n=1 Tax=Lampropedia puyangensis TaxID=1330072 RepID=A0A4S8F5X9_9BURK|nr:GIY-YIG nuclease family protein [Lampropedia puyangensis]THU02838.1 GIY-YIG nuclease family protein [Lampropedia puyangensis]
MKPFFVYILRCQDGSYYTGHTDDLEVRLRQHQDGKTGYTATRKPVALVWQGEFESREAALAFELQIKGCSRSKKEALMVGDWERVQQLAKSRSSVVAGECPSTGSGRTVASMVDAVAGKFEKRANGHGI